MDWMVCAYTFIAPRIDQFLENVGCRAAAVEQGLLPASQPFAGRSRRVLQHMRCSAELFRRVIEIYKTLEVVSEFGCEAFLQQIPHLRGPVAEQLDFQAGRLLRSV